jgi:hypothetical protein
MINVLEIDKLNSEAFICFYTEEDRAFNALMKLNQKQEVTDAMVLSFVTVKTSSFVEDYLKQGITIISFEMEQDLNLNLIPCLRAINDYVDGKTTIGVDISCMPIPYIAQILYFLFEHHGDKAIKIYYTEPSRYNLQNLFDYSAYSGEIDFKAVRGFEGETSQSDEVKRVLFYLMGFEMKYLNNRIPQDVAPDAIAPINGFPSYFPKYKDISLINDGTDFYERDVEIIFAEANNPFEVYNTMVTLEGKYKNYRIDIIPVCSKPMALGACLYALKNGNTPCRIIFPFPSDYKPKQSLGCGTLWEYSL